MKEIVIVISVLMCYNFLTTELIQKEAFIANEEDNYVYNDGLFRENIMSFYRKKSR